MLSYLPELDEDYEKVTGYNGTFMAIRTIIMIPILPAVVIIGLAIYKKEALVEDDEGNGGGTTIEFDVGLARISQAITLFLAVIGFVKTFWNGLKSRPALNKKMEGDSPLKTLVRVYRKYPALFWYCMALVPIANMIVSLPAILLTFMTTFLNMGSVQVSLCISLSAILSGIGSKVQPLIAKRLNLLNDLKLNITLWMFVSVFTGVLVNGPDRAKLYYLTSMIIGFVLGWSLPSMRSLYITIIPRGQNAEFMGIYQLLSGVLSWLPPFLFTILNENGMRMNVILALSSNIFAISLFFLMMMGPYDKALADAKQIDDNYLSAEMKSSPVDMPLHEKSGFDSLE